MRTALQATAPHARPHRSWLIRGILATAGLVLFRLALPWPLRGLMEIIFPEGISTDATIVSWLPSGGDPLLWFTGIFFLLALGVGILEMGQRICMAKFSTYTTHAMRDAAARNAVRLAARTGGGPERSGDLIARIVGDTARIKAGMKGILIHITQNGLLYIGVCSVFFFLSPKLACFFLVGGGMGVWIGYRTSRQVAGVFEKHRKKEGRYAEKVHDALEAGTDEFGGRKLDRNSSHRDVEVTRMITLSSLTTHVILALTIGTAIWTGARDVMAGALAPGELFLFITYVLLVHRRVIQVGRQTARSGKVVACLHRMNDLLSAVPADGDPPVALPLRTALVLEGVRVRDSRRERESRSRLRRLDWTLPAGSKVAVTGGPGSGKSTFLRVIAGRHPAMRGTRLWDETPVPPGEDLRSFDLAWLSENPVFPRNRVFRLLGLAEETGNDPAGRGAPGLVEWIGRLPDGLREKVSPATLSPGECRMLALSSILLGNASFWVLDAPLEGLSGKERKRRLERILEKARGRTLVLGVSDLTRPDGFDRIIRMHHGKVAFDGTPEEWDEIHGRKTCRL